LATLLPLLSSMLSVAKGVEISDAKRGSERKLGGAGKIWSRILVRFVNKEAKLLELFLCKLIRRFSAQNVNYQPAN
jgi:hypothetical protein